MITTILSEYSFLHFDEDTQTVKLQPTLFHEAGVFSESQIVFTMYKTPQLSLSVTIEVVIESCSVHSVRFDSNAVQIGYFIGDDSSYQQLPDVVQEPACNLPIESYSFTGSSTMLSSKQIEDMIEIDINTVHTLTKDFSLIGEKITLEIHPYSSYFDESIESRSLTFIVLMRTIGPEFEETPTASDLYCNSEDSEWEMKVPEIKF